MGPKIQWLETYATEDKCIIQLRRGGGLDESLQKYFFSNLSDAIQ
jgi:hypothetical protein